jgi:hypothetical protein
MSVILPLNREHIELHVQYAEVGRTPLAERYSWDALLAQPGWALVDDGRVTGIGGIVNLWRGVGEAWVSATDDLLKHPLMLGRGVLKTLEYVQSQGTYHRLQMTTPKVPEMCRWAAFLGFHLECIMRKYLWNGEDRYLFARLYGS